MLLMMMMMMVMTVMMMQMMMMKMRMNGRAFSGCYDDEEENDEEYRVCIGLSGEEQHCDDPHIPPPPKRKVATAGNPWVGKVG